MTNTTFDSIPWVDLPAFRTLIWNDRALEAIKHLGPGPIHVKEIYIFCETWAKKESVALSRTHRATLRRVVSELRDKGMTFQRFPGSGVWLLTE